MSEPTPSNNVCQCCGAPHGKCENYAKTLNAKITVIGDSWLRLQILPEVTSEKKKRKYRAPLLVAGASRIFAMITAATGIRSMDHLYIPKCPRNLLLATGLLKEYEAEDNAFDNLRHIGVLEENIPDKPYRMDQHWGARPLGGLTPKYYYEKCDSLIDANKPQYWVIYDDFLYSKDSPKYSDSRKELYTALKGCISSDNPKWILWNPVRFGNEKLDKTQKCCEELILNDETIKERTIVFMRVDHLTDAGIGQRGDSSIEECLEGILDAIEKDHRMKNLAGCAAIVIENGVDSTFLIQLDKQGNVVYCQTFFRTARTCKAYRSDMGFIHGTSMMASCLKPLIEAENENINISNVVRYLAPGIKDGLWRILLQFHMGFPVSKKTNEDSQKSDNPYDVSLAYFNDIYQLASPDQNKIKIPKEFCVHDVLLFDKYSASNNDQRNYANEKASATYQSRVLRFPGRQQFTFLTPWLLEKQWNDLNDNDKLIGQTSMITAGNTHCDGKISKFENPNDFLDKIVWYGLKRLSEEGIIKFPVARFNNMVAVDPEEISMFRRLQNLMRKYIADDDKKPLGLAVFGSPGSGKSFVIKEVAKTVNTEIKLIECNLAQFTSANDLYKKLLEARNYAREGQCPIVFLDEFDSPLGDEPFGWFKHLLAVLQDGTFRFDGTLFDIGKAFVVCAGGLNHSFQAFEWKSRNPKFRDAKIPDLISRLRGHVNIKGVNPYFPYPSANEPDEINNQPFQSPTLENYDTFLLLAETGRRQQIKKLAEKDPLHKIRRAVLLRGLLKTKMPFIHNEKNELAIGNRVLRALLDISEYKYETRSIEAIIDMSVSVYRDSRRFTKAMIPSSEQLEMHVNAEEFYKIMEDTESEKSEEESQDCQ